MGRGPGRPRRGDRNLDRSRDGPRGDMGPGAGGPPAVLMVHGLDTTMNPNRLFNLFCMYGDVNKVRSHIISHNLGEYRPFSIEKGGKVHRICFINKSKLSILIHIVHNSHVIKFT